MKSVYAVILAAGKGKRMKTRLPKVLHVVGGRTMVEHATILAQKVRPKGTLIVVPKEYQAIKEALFSNGISNKNLSFTIQSTPLGTGHALKSALTKIKAKSALVVVLNGDMPLIKPSSLMGLISYHQKKKAVITLMSALVTHPRGFGRIIRDSKGLLANIVEEKDATAAQRKISEVNVGVYVFDLAFLRRFIGKLNHRTNRKNTICPIW